jgi:hypothetical protein
MGMEKPQGHRRVNNRDHSTMKEKHTYYTKLNFIQKSELLNHELQCYTTFVGRKKMMMCFLRFKGRFSEKVNIENNKQGRGLASYLTFTK